MNSQLHHRTDLTDQEDFEILKVDAYDVRQQSSMWQISKRPKPYIPIPTGASEKARASSIDSFSPYQYDCEDDCEVIILNSTQIRDPSQPLPPPTRFSRNS
jgi:hypothetical protein